MTLLPLRCSHEMQVHLAYVPPPKELEKALAARFIMTMASSPPDKSTIKMFFYGQNVSELRSVVSFPVQPLSCFVLGVAGGLLVKALIERSRVPVPLVAEIYFSSGCTQPYLKN